jgi:hypothetical protein
MLEAECAAVERKLSAPEWSDLKDGLTAEMSSGDFWNRPDRFAVLARFALMDRVKAAAETVHALRDRARRYRRGVIRGSSTAASRCSFISSGKGSETLSTMLRSRLR